MDSNDVNLTDTKGFNSLSGISIFPHYTNKKAKFTDEENAARLSKFTDSIINFSQKIGEVIAIPEEDAIYVNGNSIEVIGTRPYYTFKNGKVEQFEIESKVIGK